MDVPTMQYLRPGQRTQVIEAAIDHTNAMRDKAECMERDEQQAFMETCAAFAGALSDCDDALSEAIEQAYTHSPPRGGSEG